MRYRRTKGWYADYFRREMARQAEIREADRLAGKMQWSEPHKVSAPKTEPVQLEIFNDQDRG